MVVILPLSLLGQTPSAILHTQGGVWVNGFEATDSSAIFTGDLLETKPGFSATLNLEGSTVQIQPESVGKFQDDVFVLDHGSVSVGTSKIYKVRVHCMTVVPVSNEWTQYDVTDLNGTVQVAAHKSDVRVEHESKEKKTSPDTEGSRGTIVHEGEQKSYSESEICGAPPEVTQAGTSINVKWVAAGAGGAGILIWLLLHGGGGKSPISASTP